MKEYVIHADDAWQRLDRFIRKLHPWLPMSEIFSGIRKGKIKVNRKKRKHNENIEVGEIVQLFYPDTMLNTTQKKVSAPKTKKHIEKDRILYEDDDLIIYNKPAGMVVHQTDHKWREDTLIDIVQKYVDSETSHTFQPALAHRIDRETSGIIIIAKTKKALEHLTEQFRKREVQKTYLAICHERPEKSEWMIQSKILRTDETNPKKPKVHVDKTGLSAETRYKKLITYQLGNDIFSLIQAHPKTGRMHQIRVHLAYIGCPIIGDKRYLPAHYKKQDDLLLEELHGKQTYKHHHLHAHEIEFTHPSTGKTIQITCEWIESGKDLLAQCDRLRIKDKT